jgi:hypothetical protein
MGGVIVRLTVVLFVAASLVGTITAQAATPPPGLAAPAPAAGPVLDGLFSPVGFEDFGYEGGSCGRGHHDGCGGCDDGCGCDDCCFDGCIEPWVRLRAEFLPLHRPARDEFVDFGGGVFPFNSNDFDFTFEPGLRVAAEFRCGCERSLEVVYFGMHRWRDEVIIDDGIDVVDGAYTSQLHGGEINYWIPIPWCCKRIKGAVTVGTKYLDLHEEFSFSVNGVNAVAIDTDNRFLATHLGFMLSGCFGSGFSVRWETKAGGGANIVTRDTASAIIDFPTQEDSDAAFIGDTNLVFGYQLGRNVSIYAGYYLMWVDGLALAPEQVLLPPTQVAHNGFLLFQGGVAGVETTW